MVGERAQAERTGDAERGAVTHSNRLCGRCRAACEQRRVCAGDAVKPEVINAKVPGIRTGHRYAEAHRGLVVCLGQTDDFHAFGPGLIVVHPRADERRQG